MQTTTEYPFENVLDKIESKERSARRRAVIYTLIPIAMAVILISYSTIKIQTATERVHILTKQAKKYETQIVDLEHQIAFSTEKIKEMNKNIEIAKGELLQKEKQLRDSREAVYYVSFGINSYHQRRYRSAVAAYDQALALDPENAYILNLKGYSLFKAKRFDEAISELQKAVELVPDYAWGYFDLGRVYCAAGKFDQAEKAINRAIKLRQGLASVMKNDGEFTRLCKPLLHIID